MKQFSFEPRRRLYRARALTYTNGWARGTVSRTANKKLTKLHWPSRKRSPTRLIVFVEPKRVEGHDKNIRTRAPLL